MNKEIKNLWAISHDGDDWGQCMSFWFAIAGTVYRHNGITPREWQFTPGLSADKTPTEWPDSEIDAMFTNDEITMNDLVKSGNVFARYANILKAQGTAY